MLMGLLELGMDTVPYYFKVCVLVCVPRGRVCNSLKHGVSPLQHIQIHEPYATFRRCRCPCAIKQCQYSIFQML